MPTPLIVHVDDEPVWRILFERRFARHGVRYVQVGLVSEADTFVAARDVRVFLIDWQLPSEPNTSGVPASARELIEKIHKQRPDVAMLILTNFPDSNELKVLVRDGVVRASDIYSKSKIEGEEFFGSLVARMTSASD